ncbi:MAG: hypothetical protein QOK43_308 [Acidimicrobiaceae bacterium]|nr:hypothetical protein [Acidimicrobiaceae bacterium]
MKKQFVAAAVATVALIGAGGLVGSAHARVTAGCRTTAYWPPNSIGPVGPVQPPPLPLPPHPALGHSGGFFLAADDAGTTYSCVYTPEALQQGYAVAVAAPWRILALSPSGAERTLVAGGPVPDANHPYVGTFTVAPGDRVALELAGTCASQIPTVTIPGTGTGIEGAPCVTTGFIVAGG